MVFLYQCRFTDLCCALAQDYLRLPTTKPQTLPTFSEYTGFKFVSI